MCFIDEMKKLRDRIDWLDSQIASLLNERMCAADQIGKVKRERQQEVVDLSRESTVLSHVEETVWHPTLKANIAHIYKEIMQESKVAQLFLKHQELPFHQIGIIGMGLIGGSICKALKTKKPSIEIATLSHSSEELAGWIDHECKTLNELIEKSELIILASPLSTIVDIAKEIALTPFHKKILIMDVASVKQEIAILFESLSSERVEYVATHPLAGKEKSGFTHSAATLFVNRPWVIVPHKKNSPAKLRAIDALLLFLGATPLTLEAELHDKQCALISHIPSLLAKSYFDFVNNHHPESLSLAGPGFQSFTRLAHDNPHMRQEMIIHNNIFITNYLKEWVTALI